MKEGLKSKLNNWIKSEQGRMIGINDIERQVKAWGYKISNYERRLRHSESPDVIPVKNPAGAIIGYKYKPSEFVAQFMREYGPKPVKEPEGVLF